MSNMLLYIVFPFHACFADVTIGANRSGSCLNIASIPSISNLILQKNNITSREFSSDTTSKKAICAILDKRTANERKPMLG